MVGKGVGHRVTDLTRVTWPGPNPAFPLDGKFWEKNLLLDTFGFFFSIFTFFLLIIISFHNNSSSKSKAWMKSEVPCLLRLAVECG